MAEVFPAGDANSPVPSGAGQQVLVRRPSTQVLPGSPRALSPAQPLHGVVSPPFPPMSPRVQLAVPMVPMFQVHGPPPPATHAPPGSPQPQTTHRQLLSSSSSTQQLQQLKGLSGSFSTSALSSTVCVTPRSPLTNSLPRPSKPQLGPRSPRVDGRSPIVVSASNAGSGLANAAMAAVGPSLTQTSFLPQQMQSQVMQQVQNELQQQRLKPQLEQERQQQQQLQQQQLQLQEFQDLQKQLSLVREELRQQQKQNEQDRLLRAHIDPNPPEVSEISLFSPESRPLGASSIDMDTSQPEEIISSIVIRAAPEFTRQEEDVQDQSLQDAKERVFAWMGWNPQPGSALASLLRDALPSSLPCPVVLPRLLPPLEAINLGPGKALLAQVVLPGHPQRTGDVFDLLRQRWNESFMLCAPSTNPPSEEWESVLQQLPHGGPAIIFFGPHVRLSEAGEAVSWQAAYGDTIPPGSPATEVISMARGVCEAMRNSLIQGLQTRPHGPHAGSVILLGGIQVHMPRDIEDRFQALSFDICPGAGGAHEDLLRAVFLD